MITLHAYNHQNGRFMSGGWIGSIQCKATVQTILDTIAILSEKYPNMDCVRLFPGEPCQVVLWTDTHGFTDSVFDLPSMQHLPVKIN